MQRSTTSTSDEASGAASAKRAEIPDAAPRALDHKAQLRYLRAVQARSSPRDRALALVPFSAGARIAETVALDVDDVRLSARKGILRIYGKGKRVREVPIHPELRKALTDWPQFQTYPDDGNHRATMLPQMAQAPRGSPGVITATTAKQVSRTKTLATCSSPIGGMRGLLSAGLMLLS